MRCLQNLDPLGQPLGSVSGPFRCGMPGRNNLIDHRIDFRTKVLLTRMAAEPSDGFANTYVKRFARLKFGHESFDFRIVEYSRMGFIPFEVAS